MIHQLLALLQSYMKKPELKQGPNGLKTYLGQLSAACTAHAASSLCRLTPNCSSIALIFDRNMIGMLDLGTQMAALSDRPTQVRLLRQLRLHLYMTLLVQYSAVCPQ